MGKGLDHSLPTDGSSLSVSEGKQGTTFRIKVQPRATRDELVGISNGILRVRLTSPPVKGAANAHCIDFLARTLGVNKGRVAIVQGAQSREKLIRVEGLSPAQVLEALTPGSKSGISASKA